MGTDADAASAAAPRAAAAYAGLPPSLYAAGAALAFNVLDASTWAPAHFVVWALGIAAAMELLGVLVLAGGRAAGCDAPAARIRNGGPPLEQLSPLDLVYISVNKLVTAAFTYHALRFAVAGGGVVWGAPTLANTLAALPLLFVAYDAVYTPFHAALHHPAVYALVHKHHHRQIAPFRGQTDAVNVHPFEFVVGEYNHLLALAAVGAGARALAAALPPAAAATAGLGPGAAGVHAAAAALFVVGGGALASLNHTRFDVALPGVFAVRYHDIHHSAFRYNYCQYTPCWDWLGGSFRAPEAAARKAA